MKTIMIGQIKILNKTPLHNGRNVESIIDVYYLTEIRFPLTIYRPFYITVQPCHNSQKQQCTNIKLVRHMEYETHLTCNEQV